MNIYVDIDDTIRATSKAVLKKAQDLGDYVTKAKMPIEFKSGVGYLYYYSTFSDETVRKAPVKKGAYKLFAFFKKIGLNPILISVQPDPVCREATIDWLRENEFIYPVHFVNSFKEKLEVVKDYNLKYQPLLIDDYMRLEPNSKLKQLRIQNEWSIHQGYFFGWGLNVFLKLAIYIHYWLQARRLSKTLQFT